MTAPKPNAELATWLDIATAAFGEPRIAFPEPTRTGRRCWAFFVDGHNFHVAIDIDNGRRRTWAGSPGRTAEVRTADDPADADVRGLLSFAWPGFAEAAEIFGPRPEPAS